MRLIGLTIVLLTFVACGSNSVEIGNKTTMEVEKIKNVGDVIKGEKVTAEFVVKNTGEYPLVISEVKPSCSCTVPEKPEEPIAPGEMGIIRGSVETERLSVGNLTKSLRIVANTTPSTTEIIIQGSIISK